MTEKRLKIQKLQEIRMKQLETENRILRSNDIQSQAAAGILEAKLSKANQEITELKNELLRFYRKGQR